MLNRTIKNSVFDELIKLKQVDVEKGAVLVYGKNDNNLIDLTIREAQLVYFPLGMIVGILVTLLVMFLGGLV